MATPVPSFTLVEDLSEDNSLYPNSSWENAYQANSLSPPPNSPYPGYAVNEPTTYSLNAYNDLSFNDPTVPDFYTNSLSNNYVTQKNLRKYNMQTDAPAPLPTPLSFPLHSYPYGTSYPSDGGYGPYDFALSNRAASPMSYGLPGVSAATVPGLQDARQNQSVQARPVDIYLYGETKFKEGYHSKLTCGDSIKHMVTCDICKNYVNGSTKYFSMIIVILLLFICILLYLLLKKDKQGQGGVGKF